MLSARLPLACIHLLQCSFVNLLIFKCTGDSIDLEYSDWEVSQQQLEHSAALPSYDLAVDVQPAQPTAAAAKAEAAAAETQVAAVEASVSNPAVAAEDGYSYSMDFASMSLQQSLPQDLPESAAAGAVAASRAATVAPEQPQGEVAGSVSQGSSSSGGSPDSLSHVRPSFRAKFDPLIEELRYRQRLKRDTAVALAGGDYTQQVEVQQKLDSQQQQQQAAEGQMVAAAVVPQQQQQQQQQGEAAEDLADVICSAAFDRVLAEVLSDAVDMYAHSSWQQQQQALAPAALQPHLQQQQQEASAATGVTAASASSVDTADTADSSSGSKSIQLDWQSSPGSPPPHLSPMTMRAAAAAAAATAESVAPDSADSPAAANTPSSPAAAVKLVDDGQQQQWQLVSHPPTDWTPLSDEVATPWSLEAAASSRYGAGSSITATDDTAPPAAAAAAAAAAAGGAELELGLGGTVRQLDLLLSQAATEGDAAAAAESAALQQQLQQGPELPDLANAAAADDDAASAVTSLAADSFESDADAAAAADAAAGLPLSSARVADGSEGSSGAAAAEDGEFDWPETEQVRPELHALYTCFVCAVWVVAGGCRRECTAVLLLRNCFSAHHTCTSLL
jgi:hypothetical protein